VNDKDKALRAATEAFDFWAGRTRPDDPMGQVPHVQELWARFCSEAYGVDALTHAWREGGSARVRTLFYGFLFGAMEERREGLTEKK